MKLKKIHIKNFKSLKDVEIDDIGDLNIFIGKNNSGKSNIFEAIKIFRSIGKSLDIENLVYDKDYKDPENIIKIRVTFELLENEREEVLTKLFPKDATVDKKDVMNTSFFRLLIKNFITHSPFLIKSI